MRHFYVCVLTLILVALPLIDAARSEAGTQGVAAETSAASALTVQAAEETPTETATETTTSTPEPTATDVATTVVSPEPTVEATNTSSPVATATDVPHTNTPEHSAASTATTMPTPTLTPAMSLSSYSGNVGQRLRVHVRKFRPNSRVAVYWDTTRKLTLITDATGTARGSFTIQPSVAGVHTVRADGALSKRASRNFEILPLIRLSSTSVFAGDSFRARISGFAPLAPVRIRIYDINDSAEFVTVGTIVTDAYGGGVKSFSVPRSTKPGDHKVLAVQSTNRDEVMLHVDESEDVVLIAAGDVACDPPFSVGSKTCHMSATGQLIQDQQPDAVLMLGDAQYETGTSENFMDSYNLSWGPFKSITYAVAGGSHDFYGGGYFSTYFGNRAGSPLKNWYSFDLGAWHIIVLNSYCDHNDNCDEQESWLAADLAANPDGCSLAAWHEPRYTSGTRHNNASGMDSFWDQLVDGGVEIILAGHEHNYERIGPIGTSDNSSSNGAVAFIVGTGGKSLESDSPSMEPLSRSYQANTYGVLRLTLRNGQADFRFLPEPGKIFTDSGTINCH